MRTEPDMYAIAPGVLVASGERTAAHRVCKALVEVHDAVAAISTMAVGESAHRGIGLPIKDLLARLGHPLPWTWRAGTLAQRGHLVDACGRKIAFDHEAEVTEALEPLFMWLLNRAVEAPPSVTPFEEWRYG